MSRDDFAVGLFVLGIGKDFVSSDGVDSLDSCSAAACSVWSINGASKDKTVIKDAFKTKANTHTHNLCRDKSVANLSHLYPYTPSKT